MHDEPFFREWSQRAAGDGRSLARAGLLAERLGLAVGDLHPLVVVGSKGKGTAATYAAAALRDAGLTVGLITSPGYRSHRERIRYDGVSIGASEFDDLAREVGQALHGLPARTGGYLSPTGAFTIAGLTWLTRRGCEALVVEAGMGGASDESSLTRPAVVGITPIFEEHLGVLGDDVAAVARDKAGMIGPSTRAVVSAPQDPVVAGIIAAAGAPISVVDPADEPGLDKLPTPLLRVNAQVGLRAAAAYLGRPVDVPDVHLPGRLSVHHAAGRTWVVDSAISPTGVRTALDWCRRTLGEPTTVLLSIPDAKDLPACRAALDTDVTLVRATNPHLSYPTATPTLADAPIEGDLVLALGTISFIGDVLTLLDVDLTRLF